MLIAKAFSLLYNRFNYWHKECMRLIKIMLVDDHFLVRTGIKLILSDTPGMVVVGEASSGEEATRLVRELLPDVILMDVDMPGIGGLEATRKLLRISPHAKILVITAYSDDLFASRLLQSGAAGYITKDAGKDELVHAVKTIFSGQRYLSTSVANQLALAHVEHNESPFAKLSERELQILLMIVRGISLQQIAKQLYLSPKTISSYRHNIFKKLGVNSDVEMTLLAIQFGLLDAEMI
jgi:two-component system, NarL family, invasion response regulator UvrY